MEHEEFRDRLELFSRGHRFRPGRVYGRRRRQATAKTNNSVYFSTNGQSWSNLSLTVIGTYSGIYTINNIFIAGVYTNVTPSAFYYYGNTNLSSPRVPLATPLACTWMQTGENSSLYTSVDNGINASNIYSSSDYSTNWISHNTGFTNTFNCITYANVQFIAAGSGGGIFISGIVPPSVSVQMQSNSRAQLTLSGGVGPTYQLQASTHLSTWTSVVTSGEFNAVGILVNVCNKRGSVFLDVKITA
jgi:hypothetical protein